jgi:hypothetical protein
VSILATLLLSPSVSRPSTPTTRECLRLVLFDLRTHLYLLTPFLKELFAKWYSTIHRLETNKLRNVAKLFAHLLFTDSLSWSVLAPVRLTEEDTTSSSRIFLKVATPRFPSLSLLFLSFCSLSLSLFSFSFFFSLLLSLLLSVVCRRCCCRSCASTCLSPSCELESKIPRW